MKAPINCMQCDVGLHEEYYYTYHEIREGIVLDLAYKINLVRATHKYLHKLNRKTVRYHSRRVKPAIHQGVELPRNHLQDDREQGEWEDSSEAEASAQSQMSGSEASKDAC